MDTRHREDCRRVRIPATTDYPIDATGDVVTGDTIKFTEAVFAGSFRKPIYLGDRVIEAEIIRDSYGAEKQQHTFTIRILRSTGTDAVPVGTVTTRKGRNIYRRGVQRQIWQSEDARASEASEKHKRGDDARQAREQRRSGMVNGCY